MISHNNARSVIMQRCLCKKQEGVRWFWDEELRPNSKKGGLTPNGESNTDRRAFARFEQDLLAIGREQAQQAAKRLLEVAVGPATGSIHGQLRYARAEGQKDYLNGLRPASDPAAADCTQAEERFLREVIKNLTGGPKKLFC